MPGHIVKKDGREVCRIIVAPDKDGGNDLLMVKDNKAKSARSTTEMLNWLLKEKVQPDEMWKAAAYLAQEMGRKREL